MGLRRSLAAPVGGARHGVLRTAEFLMEKTGTPDGELSAADWLRLPEQSLAEAVNGEIYFDRFGEVSAIRKKLAYYPEIVRLKKLAGSLLIMAQSGQYNYKRCLQHGESAAAQLAVFEFVKNASAAIFLLNDAYQPYYKWTFRALRMLPKLSIEAELMEYLLCSDNEPASTEEKTKVIEGIASDVIDELMNQKLTQAICTDLEKHANSVNDSIADGQLRNLNILAAV
jgi:hypothetical protein